MKILKSKKLLATIAVVLMIGLVAGMGAVTFARYISTGNHAATATAAKWGYVVNLNADNLFSTDYVKGAGDYSVPTTSDAGVAISAANKSLAPGATGSLEINVSGTAEVLAELVFSLNINSDLHLDDYYPVKWSLATKTGSNDPVAVDGATNLKLSDFKTKLEGLSQTLNVGTSLDVKYIITWAWAFDVDQATNIKDTLIGYKAQNVLYANLANAIAPDATTYQTKISEANYNSASYLSYTLEFTLTATVQQILAE